MTKEERSDSIFRGIQSENMRKLPTPVTQKRHFIKYLLKMDFDLLTTHGPFYKFPIEEDIIFAITLAPKENVIVAATPANMNYKLENICLEFNTVTNETLARQLQNKYNTGFSLLYDRVHSFKTVAVEQAETLLNENINVPMRSVKGDLLLFVSDHDDGKCDSEKFENPGITNVKITIEGMANKVFTQGMRQIDQWPEIKKHFMREDIKRSHDCFMTMKKYYADDKYGLWIDLRTTEDMYYTAQEKYYRTQRMEFD